MGQSQRGGLLLILISAAGYSFFAILAKFLYENGIVSPLDILTWRFLLATPLTWLLIGLLRRNRRKGTTDASASPMPRRRLLGLGIMFGAVSASAFFSLQTLPATLYTVLLYTYPALVALGTLFFGERLSPRGWLALGLTLVGIVLTVPNVMNDVASFDPAGLVFIAGNAGGYAVYIVLSGRLLKNNKNLSEASAWSITGSLVFCLFVMVLRGVNLPPTPNAWLGLVTLAVISTVVPIFTFYAGLSRLGAARAAILSTLEPVLTLVWAVVLLHENLLPVQILGTVLIISSVVLLQLGRGESKDETTLIVEPPIVSERVS